MRRMSKMVVKMSTHLENRWFLELGCKSFEVRIIVIQIHLQHVNNCQIHDLHLARNVTFLIELIQSLRHTSCLFKGAEKTLHKDVPCGLTEDFHLKALLAARVTMSILVFNYIPASLGCSY
jgi:hypothetical protein